MRAKRELQNEHPGEEKEKELREVRVIIDKLRELFTQYTEEKMSDKENMSDKKI